MKVTLFCTVIAKHIHQSRTITEAIDDRAKNEAANVHNINNASFAVSLDDMRNRWILPRVDITRQK